MTKPDHTATGQVSRPLLGQILFYVGFCLALGGIGAGLLVLSEKGFDPVPVAIIGVLVLIGAGITWFAIRIGDFDPPSLKSDTGKSQLILLVSCILGGVVGVYLTASGTMDRFLDGDFTISRAEAIVGLVVLFGMAVPMSIYREKTADDFEKASAREAAYWSLSFYFIAYMAWKTAELGTLVPPVQDFTLFMATAFLFLGVWVFKRAG